MNTERSSRFGSPRELDERVRFLQLLVIRDAFMAVLLMAVLFVIGLAFFSSFVQKHLGEIGGIAIVCVGLVAWISNRFRGGLGIEQKVPFAKGDLFVAPFLAAIVLFLLDKLWGIGGQYSVLEWLLLYGVTLFGFLVYPIFVLLRARRHTGR